MVIPVNTNVHINLDLHGRHPRLLREGLQLLALRPAGRAQPVSRSKRSRPETSPGSAPQLCGLYHSLMFFNVKVVSKSQYTAWLASTANPVAFAAAQKDDGSTDGQRRFPTKPASSHGDKLMVDLITPPPAIIDVDHDGDEGHDEHHGATGILKWMNLDRPQGHRTLLHRHLGRHAHHRWLVRRDHSRPIGLRPTERSSRSPSTTNCFTMHGSVMIYLFAGPFAFGGLANIIVPIQIGAPDMAFPRTETPSPTGCTSWVRSPC